MFKSIFWLGDNIIAPGKRGTVVRGIDPSYLLLQHRHVQATALEIG